MKIYGSLDAVAKQNEIGMNSKNLPPTTRYIGIEGANHAKFGFYGFQLGDHSASISREDQLDATLKAVIEFIKE